MKFTTSVFAATIAFATPAFAQTANCADHSSVVERLASGYGESRQSIGLAADGTVVEIFASLETGSWTITVTRAGGPTCLVASGQEFQHLEEDLAFLDPDA